MIQPKKRIPFPTRKKQLVKDFSSQKLIDTSEEKFEQNLGLKAWADIQNLKIAASSYSETGSIAELEKQLAETTGLFKGKERKALQEKIAGLEDRVKRQMAEFENFRKRTEKEKQTMFSMGERSVIEKMLPIVDNFERGLAAVPENEKDTALASGMEMVYRQLVKQLEDLGVTPIEAVGQEFDPSFHNAVMQVESDEYPSGTVAQEFQKGYKYHDSVIRYSMVGVVQ